MKRSTLSKLALTLVAAFVFVGANAQDPAAIRTDYVNVDETIYQTEGFKLTLYAAPDPLYHPSYDAVTNTGFNTMSQWQWVYDGTDFSTGSTVLKAWTTGENYVEILPANLPAAGSTRIFRVKERFNVAGACESATEQFRTVAVVAAPVITAFAGTNVSTSWTQVTAGTEYSYCGEGLGDNLSITLTENGSDATLREYTYGITALRTAYDGNMTAITGQEDIDVTSTLGKTADLGAMIAGLSHTFTTPALNMYEASSVKYATKYVFNVTANSLTSKISRLSHKRADIAVNVPFNNVPATTVTYWLYPTPTTGPIYHIPNNFTF